MFNRATDFTFDIYDGETNQFLGETRFDSASELDKFFLDIVNYGKVPLKVVLRNAEMYLPAIGYVTPRFDQKQKRRMIVRALYTDANSGEQVPIEIRLKYTVLFREAIFSNIYRSVELSDIIIEGIKYLNTEQTQPRY